MKRNNPIAAIKFREEDHTYWDGDTQVPSFSSIVKGCGLVDLSGIDPLVLERARLLGTATHKATELLDLKKLDWLSVDNGILNYVLAWESFVLETDFHSEWIEKPLYNKRAGYACTPDRWGSYMREIRVVVDIKTTSSIKRLAQLQTWAQADALRENGMDTEHRIVVQLKPDGTYKVRRHKDDADDEKVWNACLSYYKTKDEASLAVINEWKKRFKRSENVY